MTTRICSISSTLIEPQLYAEYYVEGIKSLFKKVWMAATLKITMKYYTMIDLVCIVIKTINQN